MSEFLLRYRKHLSAAGSAIVMLSLLLQFHALAPKYGRPDRGAAPIELTFDVPEYHPPAMRRLPQPAPIPAIHRDRPQATTKPARPVAASTTQSVPPAKTSAAPAPPTIPVREAPMAAGPAIPQAVSSARATDAHRNAEAIYIGKVRALLQAARRYPTSREASLTRPAGISVVWFRVRRSGELVDAGIEASSGSMLLDNAALATVRRNIYPVFPDEAWPGKAMQRFTVELNFIPAK